MLFSVAYIFFIISVTIRDPSNMPCAIKNFRVVMKDLHSQPPVLSVGKKMMSDAVSSSFVPVTDGILMNTLNTENYNIKYSCKFQISYILDSLIIKFSNQIM